MKSSIKVELNLENKPIILVKNYGHPYYDDQDLRDKVLSQIFRNNPKYLKVENVSGGGDATGTSYTNYELSPQTKSHTVSEFDYTREGCEEFSIIMPDKISPADEKVFKDCFTKMVEQTVYELVPKKQTSWIEYEDPIEKSMGIDSFLEETKDHFGNVYKLTIPADFTDNEINTFRFNFNRMIQDTIDQIRPQSIWGLTKKGGGRRN